MLTGGAETPAVLILPYRLNDPVNDLLHALLLIRGSRNMRGRLVEVLDLFRLDFPLFIWVLRSLAPPDGLIIAPIVSNKHASKETPYSCGFAGSIRCLLG